MLKEKILYILEKNKGKLVTGGEIARELGVSRTAVWKAVALLREEGNEIESIPNSGYRLVDNSDGLSLQSIKDNLRTKKFGQNMELLKTVGSTNQYLKEQDTTALPEGHVVTADEQTAGKGRLGRTFYSPIHSGIYLSCLLKPRITFAETPFLTICAAVAVCRAIEGIFPIKVDIKWVNDIFYQGKKLCGILTEAFITAEMQSVDYAIVGIGVNTGEVAEQVADIATSTYIASGIRGVRNILAAEILNQLEQVYLDYTERGKKQEILSAYAEKLFIMGKQVEVVGTKECYSAKVLGVSESGALIVKNGEGKTIHVSTGEIRLI